ncbi:hypothetical protein pipiens_010317 [Culex pipiens pipiens]|uniref:trypsin n=1 Tax=Culex pipiens pipiens TaxID=38569 RepID=A0ABD1DAP9_CULPP
MIRVGLLVIASLALGATQDVDSDFRIIGGRPVNINTVPYQVSVIVQYGTYLIHTCGGSILDEDTILTAAHCVTLSTRYFIRAGSTNNRYGGQFVEVSEIIVHPDNDPSTFDYDVCILKLKRKLDFGALVKPIKLADSEKYYKTGTKSLVSGWGALQNEGSITDKLQAVSVPLVDHTVCKEIYSEINDVTDRMFCAGLLGVGGRDSCQGDSGGPLAADGVLIGVVSWGNECAAPDYPGVYANVLALKSWVESKMG